MTETRVISKLRFFKDTTVARITTMLKQTITITMQHIKLKFISIYTSVYMYLSNILL